MKPQHQYRSPKPEIRKKSEARNASTPRTRNILDQRCSKGSGFGFRAYFGLRISNLGFQFQLALFAILSLALPALAAEDTQALRVFIRASRKTHGPGAHDYPRFLEDWKKLLNDRGAVAEGALRPPTDAELAKTDVLIVYASDGTNMGAEDRSRLESFLKRGGGLVALHDSICGTNTDWFASIAGGAKQHGEMNWKTGPLKLQFKDRSHPIVQGLDDFEMDDEMFFRLRTAADVRVLATAVRTGDEAVPQLWVYEKSLSEGRPYRAFVSLQGHWYDRFSQPEYQRFLLRGIAWAGKRPVDSLAKGFRFTENPNDRKKED